MSREESCKVANTGCEAAANLGGHARFLCWACGDPVCGSCSTVRLWRTSAHPTRRRRICSDCVDQAAWARVCRKVLLAGGQKPPNPAGGN